MIYDNTTGFLAVCTLAPLCVINCNWCTVRQWVASSDGLISLSGNPPRCCCYCYVILLMFCCIVDNKNSLSLSFSLYHRGLQPSPALPLTAPARIDWPENDTCQSRGQMQNVCRRDEENRVMELNGDWC